MRNANLRWGRASRGSYSQDSFTQNNKMLLYIIGAIVAIFFVFKIFSGGGTSEKTGSFMTIAPADAKSIVYITDANNKKTQITKAESLYATDISAFVESGSATGAISSSFVDFSGNTEFAYTNETTADSTTKNDVIKFTKGTAWVDSSANNLIVKMANLSAKIPSGSIAIVEQTNTFFSSVYAIRGNIEITTSVGQYTLTPGKKISLSSGDNTNANTVLEEKANDFDSSVANMEIFIRNNGEEILKSSQTAIEETTDNTATGTTSTGATTETGAILTTGKYIAFTQPTDGASIKTATTNIMGTLLSTEVSRVTFNDQDASVSAVNESFSMEKFPIQNGINNIVYKVYSASGIELERGVLVVHGSGVASSATTIIPENFPNLKDFVITSPKSNPYATTESYVKVSGSIPAKTVQYITVNGFRLTKFVPNSTTWYYHANADIGTIKEGTNLYHIKFFDANNKEIHTQIFTIIKDTKNATTTEQTITPTPLPSTTTGDSPLFPTT